MRSYLLRQPAGRVSVRIEDGLPYEDYCEEIARADYVLCMYDPESYRLRSSGIALEAGLLNVPLVITKGMAVESDIQNPEKVFVLPDQRPESLEALCISLDNQQMYRTGAPAHKSLSTANSLFTALTSGRSHLQPESTPAKLL